MCYLVQGDNQVCIYIHGEINRSRQETLGALRDFNNAIKLLCDFPANPSSYIYLIFKATIPV